MPVHVIYSITPEQATKAAEEGTSPKVMEIADSALADHEARGFVRVNPDGTPYKAPTTTNKSATAEGAN